MSLEMIDVEPQIVDIKCGVCVRHETITIIGNQTEEIVEYCEGDAVQLIQIDVPEQDPAQLPVCEKHSDMLDAGTAFVIRENTGDRKFMIQFGGKGDDNTSNTSDEPKPDAPM